MFWTTFVFMTMLKSDICQMSSVECQMSLELIYRRGTLSAKEALFCTQAPIPSTDAWVVSHPWDMPNNFCFNVYAPKSLLICENNKVFYIILTRTKRNHRAGSKVNFFSIFIIISMSQGSTDTGTEKDIVSDTDTVSVTDTAGSQVLSKTFLVGNQLYDWSIHP